MECLGFNKLPEGCVSIILSLTSPPDACKSSLVSPMFRAAAESDVVWERFLPADYHDILCRLVEPLVCSSRKELFLRLCDPILIDGGSKSFRLDKWSGKKSYLLSARELSITWSNDPMYWSWRSTPESRFSHVAELRTMCWLEIHGKMRTQMLSPNTKYGAYLIMKISNRAYGLDLMPSEISVEVSNSTQVCNGTAYLRCSDSKNKQMERLFYGNRREMLRSRVIEGDGRVPCEREDGWMELELGDFFNGEGDEEVRMSLREVKGYHLKGGLIIEGIEVRPNDSRK
ncbi:F-box protein PP2-B13-like [Vitis riparia]|uniref:F-box protein PP2-B13-like n=1 Tax=Vitis riparia TaxID=96939 RepID=UPI00155AD42D|nr:F-box protein PP2-B13-like [Vitis riparia]